MRHPADERKQIGGGNTRHLRPLPKLYRRDKRAGLPGPHGTDQRAAILSDIASGQLERPAGLAGG